MQLPVKAPVHRVELNTARQLHAAVMETREQPQQKVKGMACVWKQTALICVCHQAREGCGVKRMAPSLEPQCIPRKGAGTVSSGQALAETPLALPLMATLACSKLSCSSVWTRSEACRSLARCLHAFSHLFREFEQKFSISSSREKRQHFNTGG